MSIQSHTRSCGTRFLGFQVNSLEPNKFSTLAFSFSFLHRVLTSARGLLRGGLTTVSIRLVISVQAMAYFYESFNASTTVHAMQCRG